MPCPPQCIQFPSALITLAQLGGHSEVMESNSLTSVERLSKINVEDRGLESKHMTYVESMFQGTSLPQFLEETKIPWPRKEYLFYKIHHPVTETKTETLAGDCPVHTGLQSMFTFGISLKTHQLWAHPVLCPLPPLLGVSEGSHGPPETELGFGASLSALPCGHCELRAVLSRGCSRTL